MKNNKFFWLVSLVAVVTVGSAFAADSSDYATIGYVQNYTYKKVAGQANATQKYVQDYTYKKEVISNAMKTNNDLLTKSIGPYLYEMDSSTKTPAVPLRTEGKDAFSGINEVLGMVNGNDGENSAVTLETTAQNAYGAINELKNSMPAKVSDLTNDSGFLAAPANPQANKVYLYTNSGWSESGVKDTFVAF